MTRAVALAGLATVATFAVGFLAGAALWMGAEMTHERAQGRP